MAEQYGNPVGFSTATKAKQNMVFEHTMMTLFAELRETPMQSLPQLEHALLTWAQVALENIMQPDYVALVRVLIAELPRFPSLGPLFFSVLPQEGSSVLRALLESAAAHGVIKARDLDATIQLFVGPLLMYIIGALMRPNSSLQPFRPNVWQHSCNCFFMELRTKQRSRRAEAAIYVPVKGKKRWKITPCPPRHTLVMRI